MSFCNFDLVYGEIILNWIVEIVFYVSAAVRCRQYKQVQTVSQKHQNANVTLSASARHSIICTKGQMYPRQHSWK